MGSGNSFFKCLDSVEKFRRFDLWNGLFGGKMGNGIIRN